MDIKLKIGLETHIQINSVSKLFSRASTQWDNPPNSQLDYIDYGIPGALPVLNGRCLIQGIKAGIVLKGQISENCSFCRKHYLYPDSPTGYQITQERNPLMTNGTITLSNGKVIRIKQMHMECDAGKSVHGKEFSLIDFNRTGIGLLEIVSEPDLSTPEEAGEYVKIIRLLMMKAGVSGCNMEEGKMRVDANVSIIHAQGASQRCEIKNLNSIKSIRDAIMAEGKRQLQEVKQGIPHKSFTLRFDVEKNITIPMREKEKSLDYRYFPEYDITPIPISPEMKAEAYKEIGPCPISTIENYVKNGILRSWAEIMVEDTEMETYFNQVSHQIQITPISEVANWVFGEVMGICNSHNTSPWESKITADKLAVVIEKVKNKKISVRNAKELLAILFDTGDEIEEIINKYNFHIMNDPLVVQNMISQVLQANPELVKRYKNGEEKLFSALLGQCMKKAKGSVDPLNLSEALNKLLEKY